MTSLRNSNWLPILIYNLRLRYLYIILDSGCDEEAISFTKMCSFFRKSLFCLGSKNVLVFFIPYFKRY